MPKEINELYASVFDFRLRYIWQKITQAFKAIKQDILTKADLISIGANIIKRIFQVWKEKSRSEYVDMTVDEMCASAFKTAREVFYNALDALHMEDYAAYVERRTIHYAREQAVLIPDVREIYILHDVKSEKISTSEFKIREQAAIQLEEAKQCIPYLE